LLPIITECIDLAKDGIIPGGAYNNRKHLEGKVVFKSKVVQYLEDIMFDPQTSGGLMFAVSEEKAEGLLQLLKTNNKTACAIIGKVKEKTDYPIEIY
jgi:selenide,water dikinase